MRHLTVLMLLGILSGAIACKSDGTGDGSGNSGSMAGRSGGDAGGNGDDEGNEGRDAGGTDDGEPEDGGQAMHDRDAGHDAGDDSGDTGDAMDAGGDAMTDAGSDAGNIEYITEADCGDLPGVFDGYDPEYEMYGDVCVELDWATNPCVVRKVACPGDGLFFEWSREPDGYFNLKIYGTATPIEATAGTVNEKPGNSTAPASVTGLPVGEFVLVKIDDPEDENYDVRFRRDGDALTIDYIIQRF